MFRLLCVSTLFALGVTCSVCAADSGLSNRAKDAARCGAMYSLMAAYAPAPDKAKHNETMLSLILTAKRWGTSESQLQKWGEEGLGFYLPFAPREVFENRDVRMTAGLLSVTRSGESDEVNAQRWADERGRCEDFLRRYSPELQVTMEEFKEIRDQPIKIR